MVGVYVSGRKGISSQRPSYSAKRENTRVVTRRARVLIPVKAWKRYLIKMRFIRLNIGKKTTSGIKSIA